MQHSLAGSSTKTCEIIQITNRFLWNLWPCEDTVVGMPRVCPSADDRRHVGELRRLLLREGALRRPGDIQTLPKLKLTFFTSFGWKFVIFHHFSIIICTCSICLIKNCGCECHRADDRREYWWGVPPWVSQVLHFELLSALRVCPIARNALHL